MSEEIKEVQPPSEVVVVVFLNDNGQVLLEQRIEDDAFKNQWTVPGGKVETEDRIEGRDYRITAAVRESIEELSLVPTKTKFLDSFVGVSRNGNTYLFHVVGAHEWIGNLQNKEPEKRRLAWLTFEEARQKMEDTPVGKAELSIISNFLNVLSSHPTQQST